MRRQTLLGLGAIVTIAAYGCGNDDPAPGSTIVAAMAGTAGVGGQAGSLDLGLGSGKGGGGAGGAAGTAGSAGTAGGGAALGGAPAAGAANHAGSGSSVGGSKPAGTCTRAPASDADCADFEPTAPQAWSCTDRAAFSTLNSRHGKECLSGNFVPGSPAGGCCPP